MATPIPNPTSNWLHDFPNLKISTKEFYLEVEAALNARLVPKTKVANITLSTKGMFSASREYLRVSSGDQTFDICAAPFGTGFFISWWYGERLPLWKSILLGIPVIQWFVIKLDIKKTYYELDTESMFREAVRSCVNDAISKMTSAKGLRGLSDIELQTKS